MSGPIPGSVRRAVVGLLAGGLCVFLAWPAPAAADLRDQYRYKFPCGAGEDCAVTQTAHVNNALDFDIGGWAYDGIVRAMSQGTVDTLHFDAYQCTWPDSHGLGLWAEVQDIFSKVNVYGHLASFSVSEGQQVLQGDPLGQEGNTGYSQDCAVHLHWEPGGALPSYIDSVETSSLCATCWYDSTNAPGGEIWGYFVPFPSIRDHYIDHGGWGLGWTHDVGRPGLPFPQGLYVHNYRTWGWEQTFANNPWYTGAIELGLYAPAWDPGVSQLIELPYWRIWNVGVMVGNGWRSISLPMGDRDACPPGSISTCAGYQLFHLGYIWNDWSVVYGAVWCPDVMATGWPTEDHKKDGAVTILNDVLAVLEYTGTQQGGPPNSYGHLYDPWFDMEGDGFITILSDVLAVLAGSGVCRPT